jgi:succinoglycan biosynthesis protein ExoO
MVFLGSDSLPNLDGLRWFIADIWPLLTGHGITLDIIGDAGTALGPLPAGMTSHGRVQNPGPILHRASLAIAPLRVGSGLKIKLLDYARHGLTTITTSSGLAGFVPDGAPFILADTKDDFAHAILMSLANPPSDLAALGYIKDHYGNDSVFDELAAALACNKIITKQ